VAAAASSSSSKAVRATKTISTKVSRSLSSPHVESELTLLSPAFDKGTQSAGMGGKLNRDQSEKVTDGLRSAFEKATG
jgi:hypothetical protein